MTLPSRGILSPLRLPVSPHAQFILRLNLMVLKTGLEPATYCLQGNSSTIEILQQFIRKGFPQLI